MPEDQRVVLVLRDVEQFTTEAIGERLGLTPAAVRQRLHRARKIVAEELSPELCGAGEMTCGGRLDLLLDLLDDMLAEELRIPVQAHVGTCTTCQRYAEGYRRTIALPDRTKVESVVLSAEHVERLVEYVKQQTA